MLLEILVQVVREGAQEYAFLQAYLARIILMEMFSKPPLKKLWTWTLGAGVIRCLPNCYSHFLCTYVQIIWLGSCDALLANETERKVRWASRDSVLTLSRTRWYISHPSGVFLPLSIVIWKHNAWSCCNPLEIMKRASTNTLIVGGGGDEKSSWVTQPWTCPASGLPTRWDAALTLVAFSYSGLSVTCSEKQPEKTINCDTEKHWFGQY